MSAAAPRFRFLSDLHAEFYQNAEELLATIPWDVERDAQSFLVLAGDVGCPLGTRDGANYRALLAALAARFRGVFLVAGNHEYYRCGKSGRSMAEVDAVLDALCRDLHTEARPVVFLQKGEWTVYVEQPGAPPGTYHVTQLLGCSLWSPVTAAAALQMNDERFIGVTAPWIRAVHTEHLAWLRGKLSSSSSSSIAPAPPATAAEPPPLDSGYQSGDTMTRRAFMRRSHRLHAQRLAAAQKTETRTVELPDDDNDVVAAAAPMPRFTVVRLDGSASSQFPGGGGPPPPPLPPPHLRLVATHHVPLAAPDDDLDTRTHGDVSSAYYADVFRRGGWPEAALPDLWYCGHLHSQVRQRVGRRCAVFTNCHGYRRPFQLAWGVRGDPHRPTRPLYSDDLEAFMAAAT